MFSILKKSGLWIGVGSFIAGMFVTSKCARKIAVKSMAAGMQARDGIKSGWDNIKEEATDIYEEAKEEAASKADDHPEKPAPVAATSQKTPKTTAKKRK